jgi:hypothetical protein
VQGVKMAYTIVEAFTAAACTEVFLGNWMCENGVNSQCFGDCHCLHLRIYVMRDTNAHCVYTVCMPAIAFCRSAGRKEPLRQGVRSMHSTYSYINQTSWWWLNMPSRLGNINFKVNVVMARVAGYSGCLLEEATEIMLHLDFSRDCVFA